MKTNEICVPLKSLAIPAEGGAEVPPAQGDEVDVQGTATVSRVEGDKAYLTLKTVNGEALDAAPATEPSLEDEEGEMRSDAKKTDAARIY